MELETFAKERQRGFFNAAIANDDEDVLPSREARHDEDEDDDDDADGGEGHTQGGGEEQDDMRVMKEAHKDWSEDQYYGGSNVTALVQLDEYEREDDALVITMNNIHKTYLLGVEGVPALRGVSMSVRRGEFLIIYGTSGGGKTSLLNIMGTIDKPTKGNMRICNTRISRSTTDTELSEIRRSRLGFVFQTFNLLSSLTALENVMLPMILAGKYNRAERRQRAIQLLTRVGMGKRLDHLPSQLSGGEQQRVTIARSIANEPDILLLDEPTGDLDTVNTVIAMKLLTDLHVKDKLTLVMVTHELAHKPFADRVIWMRDGKIQTVEHIPAKKRAEAHAKLHAQFAELSINQDTFDAEAAPAHDEEMGLATNPALSEVAPDVKSSVSFTHTELRKPQSYSTHHSSVTRNAKVSRPAKHTEGAGPAAGKGKVQAAKGAGVFTRPGERRASTGGSDTDVNPRQTPAYLADHHHHEGSGSESNSNSPLIVLP